MNYLKLFQTHEEYEAFVSEGGGYIEPNVSYCVNENEVHYDFVPYIEGNIPKWNYLKSIAGVDNLGYWDRYYFNNYEILMFEEEVNDEDRGEFLYRIVAFEAVENGNSRVAWYPYCSGIIVETSDPENYPLTEIRYKGWWSDCK